MVGRFKLCSVLFSSLAVAAALKQGDFHSSIGVGTGFNIADNSTLQGFTKEGIAAFNSQLRKFVDDHKLANVVTLIARNGQVVNLDSYGVLDVSAPTVKATEDTIFRLASMSKPITGAAMMMLFEEGKWALNDPVQKHIPQFKGLKVKQTDGNLVPQAKLMTMAQLMSHTAGFGGSNEYTTLRKGDLQDMIDELAKLPLSFQPGKEWRYGPSVDVQGYLVEKMSGMRFDEFLQKRLFNPLGMTDTGFWVDPSKVGRVSRIHENDGKGGIRATGNTIAITKPKFLSGAGGLSGTIQDYWRFTQMILNGGEFQGTRYLKESTVQIVHTNVVEPGVKVSNTPGLGFGMDYAIVLDPVAARTSQGVQSFYWGGAFGTWFWIDPINKLIVIGMIQNSGGSPPVREVSAKAAYAALRR